MEIHYYLINIDHNLMVNLHGPRAQETSFTDDELTESGIESIQYLDPSVARQRNVVIDHLMSMLFSDNSF
jgi:hypothetical protein